MVGHHGLPYFLTMGPITFTTESYGLSVYRKEWIRPAIRSLILVQ